MERVKNLSLKKKLIAGAAALVAVVLVSAGGFYGYIYASTPSHIGNPEYEHYHFRTQLLVNGEAVNFGADKFQVEYDSATCSVELSGHPVDFHDNEDQMTHVHWDGMTGGEFLKYFGWNYIGGRDDSLGRRLDQGMMNMPHVHTFGKLLPAVPENANFYVYTGDEDGYEQRNWDDFLKQDLEEFFGTKSNLKQNVQTSFNLGDWLFPKAAAHGAVVDDHDDELSDAELTRINNLIGNVVIFVQPNEPTDEQIKARFDNLEPLKNSTCGG